MNPSVNNKTSGSVKSMPLFKPVSVSDRAWIYPLAYTENTQNADYSFMNLLAWSNLFNIQSAEISGCCVIETIMDGELTYSFPLGAETDERLRTVIETLRGRQSEKPLRLQSVTPDTRGRLESLFPSKFSFTARPDLYDYIYLAEKLASLAGKKLHAKRNYINNFTASFNWRFDPINETNLSECENLYELWANSRQDAETDINGEYEAFKKMLDNFTPLRLDGGILTANGNACAFTVGERLSRETYVIHFEKARQDVIGAYQMINREFVRHVLSLYPEVKYINREEDMGMESLRKSKRSYYPDSFVEKYTAIWAG
jgi:hypothetical protein